MTTLQDSVNGFFAVFGAAGPWIAFGFTAILSMMFSEPFKEAWKKTVIKRWSELTGYFPVTRRFFYSNASSSSLAVDIKHEQAFRIRMRSFVENCGVRYEDDRTRLSTIGQLPLPNPNTAVNRDVFVKNVRAALGESAFFDSILRFSNRYSSTATYKDSLKFKEYVEHQAKLLDLL